MREVTSVEEFQNAISEGVVLAEFFSKTCGPCKMLKFVLDSVEKKVDDIEVIQADFEEFPELVEKYEVEGYPTMIVFKDGEEVDRRAGLQQEPTIINMLEEAK